jgi:hypothetical protein
MAHFIKMGYEYTRDNTPDFDKCLGYIFGYRVNNTGFPESSKILLNHCNTLRILEHEYEKILGF